MFNLGNLFGDYYSWGWDVGVSNISGYEAEGKDYIFLTKTFPHSFEAA